MRTLLTAIALNLLLASVAFAQAEGTSSPTPSTSSSDSDTSSPASTTPAGTAGATTESSETSFAPPPAAEVAAESEEAEAAEEPSEGSIRFTGVRVGLSLGGGFFVGAVGGGMGGIGVGLGAQFGPLGFMYKFHFFTGYYTSQERSENFYAAWNTVIVDYKFLKFFELGVGPSIDFVWNCLAEPCRNAGPYFGVEARFAVKLGPIKVGLGIHPTFFDGGALNTMFIYFGI